MGTAIPADPAQSAGLRAQAQQHPDYPLIFCSRDSRFGGIIIRTDFNAQIDYGLADSTGPVSGGFGFDETDGTAYHSPLDNELPVFKTSWIQDYTPFMSGIYEILGKAEYTRHLNFYPAGSPELMGFLGRELEKEMVLIILCSIVLILLVLGVLFRSVKAMVWPLVIIFTTIIWSVGTMGWVGMA